jgi:hypothetical protein
MSQVISVTEARKILGKDAEGMSDEELRNIIHTLDLLAKDALRHARESISVKKDAKALADLTYNIHKDSKKKNS